MPPQEQLWRIGQAARELKLRTSVLRFWEDEFPDLSPIRTPSGQRLYTADDMALLRRIRQLLHEDRMTIDGVRRLLETEAGASLSQDELDARHSALAERRAAAAQRRREKAEAARERNSSPPPETLELLRDLARELRELRSLLGGE